MHESRDPLRRSRGYGISTATPLGTVIIRDCSSSATVNGKNPAGGGAGGLLGTCRAAACVISRSFSSGSVTSTNLAGGLVGTGVNTNIVDSYSTATVSGGSLVGGLVGSGTGLGIRSWCCGFKGGLLGLLKGHARSHRH